MNIRKLWLEGLAKANLEKTVSEAARGETYRGGSSGILFEDGYTAGTCPRKALARSLGYSESHTPSKHLMFAAGERNEDTWLHFLSHSSFQGTIRRGPDIISWQTEAGTTVTGSVDLLFFDRKDKPVHGLELKHVSSISTANTVLGKGEPKLDHLIQAAHYMWQMDCLPFSLIYTNSVNLTGDQFRLKELPKLGEEASEFIEYTFYHRTVSDTKYKSGLKKGQQRPDKKVKITVPVEDWDLPWEELRVKYPDINYGEIKHVRPFFVIFDLAFDEDGTLLWKREGSDGWVESPVDIPRIEAYYNNLDRMKRERNLGPRPLNLTAAGEHIEYWTPCQYCPLQKQCDKFEGNYGRWVSEVVPPK